MNKRHLHALLLAALPTAASAHAPDWFFTLMYWEMALIAGLLIFLVLPPYVLRTKLAAAGGFVLVPLFLGGFLVLLNPAPNSFLDKIFIPAVALGPIAGFFGGLRYARRK